jgi:hypothetical protein
MKGRLATWPATWRDDTIPYAAGCLICTSPCNEPGWLQLEAISTGICRCCIEYFADVVPDVIRARLAHNATQTPEQGDPA